MNLEYLVKLDELKERYESLSKDLTAKAWGDLDKMKLQVFQEFKDYLSKISKDFRYDKSYIGGDESFGKLCSVKAICKNTIVTLTLLNKPPQHKVIFSLSLVHPVLEKREYTIEVGFSPKGVSHHNPFICPNDEMKNIIKEINKTQKDIDEISSIIKAYPDIHHEYLVFGFDENHPETGARCQSMDDALTILLSSPQ